MDDLEYMDWCAKNGLYFEIGPEDTAQLAHYIKVLQRDSRALTELRQALDGEALKRDLLERLALLGAFKLKMFYEMAAVDWRAVYGSSGL